MNSDLTVTGFSFAATAAGLKKSGKPDMALIVSAVPAVAAGVFTTNKVVAAPVLLTRPRVATGRCQAILVNAGNANACTGAAGLDDAGRCGALAAASLGISSSASRGPTGPATVKRSRRGAAVALVTRPAPSVTPRVSR